MVNVYRSLPLSILLLSSATLPSHLFPHISSFYAKAIRRFITPRRPRPWGNGYPSFKSLSFHRHMSVPHHLLQKISFMSASQRPRASSSMDAIPLQSLEPKVAQDGEASTPFPEVQASKSIYSQSSHPLQNILHSTLFSFIFFRNNLVTTMPSRMKYSYILSHLCIPSVFSSTTYSFTDVNFRKALENDMQRVLHRLVPG